MYKFSPKSKAKLSTCHVHLQDLFNEVIKHRDCTILCGHRNKISQEEAFKSGKSEVRWPDSYHNKTPSLAVDVMPYPIDWNDLDRVREFSKFVKDTAVKMGIKIKWGGDFKNFFDGPHYQLEEK